MPAEVTMPSLAIDVNGTRIATIGLAGMQLVNVHVHGGLDGEQKAVLDAHGGNYAAGGCGHFIWVEEHALLPGDVVSVSLDASGDSGDRGRTIDELFPGAEPSTRTDFTISDEMATELRARPRLHERFVVEAGTSAGGQAQAASDDLNTDFGFLVGWNSFQPHQARVSLRTHCLDDVLARRGGSDHLRTTLALGESASFTLVE
jgi:hypothetical protein